MALGAGRGVVRSRKRGLISSLLTSPFALMEPYLICMNKRRSKAEDVSMLQPEQGCCKEI